MAIGIDVYRRLLRGEQAGAGQQRAQNSAGNQCSPSHDPNLARGKSTMNLRFSLSAR